MGIPSQEILYPTIIIAIAVIVSWAIHIVVHRILFKLAAKTKTNLDDELFYSLDKPILLGILLVGAYFAIRNIIFFTNYTDFVNKAFVILGVLWALLIIIKIVNTFSLWYVKSHERTTSAIIIKRILTALIYVVGIIIILAELGIEISPLLASLGIGGLAVALALQSTLANYFAGMYITSDRSIRIGDFIEIGTDLKGYVHQIGWRGTQIKTIANNIIIVPNSKLADSIITNYSEPQQKLSIILPCGVAYNSDLEKVERVTIATIKKVLKKNREISDMEPFVRFKEFGQSNINFSIIFRVKEIFDQYKTKHEVIKELMKAYKKNKIEISFPRRDIRMRKN